MDGRAGASASRSLSGMASREAWSERSGSDRRRLLGRFGLLYLVIGLVGLVLSWWLVALLFGVGGVGLLVVRSMIPEESEAPEPRAKPDWMLAMDDPNAPDLTRPEYRDVPSAAVDGPDASGVSTEEPTSPPAAPPSPTD